MAIVKGNCVGYNVEDVYPIVPRIQGGERQQGTHFMLSGGQAVVINITGPLQDYFKNYIQFIHVDQIVQHQYTPSVSEELLPFYPLDFTLTKEETVEMSREFISGMLRNTVTNYSVVHHMVDALAQLWIRERDIAVGKFIDDNPNTPYEVILHLGTADHLDYTQSLGESIYGFIYLSEDHSRIEMETSFKFEVITDKTKGE